MLSKVVEGCKALCLLAMTCAAIPLGLAAVHLNSTSRQLSATVLKANNLLDEAHRGMLEISLAAMEARRASTDQRKSLEVEVPRVFADVHSTLSHTDEVLVGAASTIKGLGDSQAEIAVHSTSLLDAGTRSVTSLQDVTRQATATLTAATTTVQHMDGMITSTDVLTSLHNINEISASGAQTAANVAAASNAVSHPHRLGRLLRWFW